MKLDDLIKVLPVGKRISQDEAIRLLARAGVPISRHDETVAIGALTGMAALGLIRRPGGPYKPDVERMKDPEIDRPRNPADRWPQQKFTPISMAPDPALIRALRATQDL
jgi:hypothetical protein